ncbi:hypothetical protein CGMCC3_g3686 [Colletotrichum fructicola]|nr:uncharacterized protein CGMCC3_g3686 [Colletotrichum fructicola]KAE9580210.1 hypothetical protein CGMCC3_g3686 [Colletotrichum fructicola]
MPKQVEEDVSPWSKTGKDAWMGAKTADYEDIFEEELFQSQPPTTRVGPTPAWLREANEILGIEEDDPFSTLYDEHLGIQF